MLKMYRKLSNILACPTWLAVFACLLTSMMVAPPGHAANEQGPALDYQVKAAMLYKFLSYTEWPEATFATPQAPYRIWLLGSAQMSDELRSIVAGRQINGRSIEVYGAGSVEQIANANVVFVSHDLEKQLPRLAHVASKTSCLIVTENEKNLPSGSTINLRLVNGRVGFDISLIAAQKYNLKLSARLLSVASSVEEEHH